MLFHCGVIPSCPFSVVHLAGLEFPKITQRITGYGDEQVNSELAGVVHDLSEGRLDAIRKSLESKVVRHLNGKRSKSFLLTKDNRGYLPQEGDVPLANYVYLRETDHDPQQERKFKTVSELEGKIAEQAKQLDAALAGKADEAFALKNLDAQLAEKSKQLGAALAELAEAKKVTAASAATKPTEAKKQKKTSK